MVKGHYMMTEYCEACETRVHSTWDNKQKADVFNYTTNMDGPYCDSCFHFIRHIEALRDRVTDLEATVMSIKKGILHETN